MSLNELTFRLGIYAAQGMASGEQTKWEQGAPEKQKGWNKDKAWERLTGRNERHNYQNAQAYHLLDPMLRICHIILVSNVNGLSSAFSKMPTSSLYFLDRIDQCIKVHLGYWLARIMMSVCKTPNRNQSLCHVIERFVRQNFVVSPDILNFDNLVSRPNTLDVACLLRAGVIKEERDQYRSYEPGEAPKEMRNLSRTEARDARKLEMRLATLDDIVQGMQHLEETVYKMRRSQINSFAIIHNTVGYTGDAIHALQNVLVNFLGKIWNLASMESLDEETRDNLQFEEEINKRLEDERLRLLQVRLAKREAGLRERQAAIDRIREARNTRGAVARKCHIRSYTY